MIRERDNEVYSILNKIRIDLLKLLAPIAPFTTEIIWQELRKMKIVKEESIHLTDWPKIDNSKINKKLEKDIEIVLEIIEKGLAVRDEAKIGLKWPLAKAIITAGTKIRKDLQEIIARQLNVKNIDIKNFSAVDSGSAVVDQLRASVFGLMKGNTEEDIEENVVESGEEEVKGVSDAVSVTAEDLGFIDYPVVTIEDTASIFAEPDKS